MIRNDYIVRIKTEDIYPCPICGCAHIKEVYKEPNLCLVRQSEVLVYDRVTSVCLRCGIVFSSKMIPKDIMKTIYEDGNIGNPLFKSNLIPNETRPHKKRYDFVMKNIKFSKKKHSVCDIGCNAGDFLSFFNKSKWNLYGVEASARASEECRKRLNADITTGYWEEIKPEEKKFDLVTAIFTLEHTYEPTKFLQNCYISLKDDGILFVEVPDIYQTEWWALNPNNPCHTMQFSPASIKYALEINGFKIIKMEKYKPTDDFSMIDGVLRIIAKKNDDLNIKIDNTDIDEIIEFIKNWRKKTVLFRKEFLWYINKRLKSQRNRITIIYGAGQHSANILFNINRVHDIDCFMDMNNGRIGYKMFNIDIYPFGQKNYIPNFILISSRDCESEMVKHVKKVYPEAEICHPYKDLDYLKWIL